MALLTVVDLVRAGIDMASAVAAAGGGDSFVNTGKEFLAVKNGSGGAITVTFVTQVTVDGQPVADLAVSVPAGHTMDIGPFPPGYYNDGSGQVQVTYSGVTSLTVMPVRLTAGA